MGYVTAVNGQLVTQRLDTVRCSGKHYCFLGSNIALHVKSFTISKNGDIPVFSTKFKTSSSVPRQKMKQIGLHHGSTFYSDCRLSFRKCKEWQKYSVFVNSVLVVGDEGWGSQAPVRHVLR